MSNNKIKRYALQIFLISSLIILVTSDNKVFANPILNESEESKIEQRIEKIEQRIEKKIKQIEDDSNSIVDLSKDSLQSINAVAGTILTLIGTISLIGGISSFIQSKNNKEEKKKFEAEIQNHKDETIKYESKIKNAYKKIKEYDKYIKKLKSMLIGYNEDMNISLSSMYEKLGDIDIERAEVLKDYKLALTNYSEAFKYNNNNDDLCYKLAQEIERAGHGITTCLNNGINEKWLENRNEALSYYDELINKNNIKGYIGKINILAGFLPKSINEIDNAIHYCEEAIKLCKDDKIKARIYSHLGFLHIINENESVGIDMYHKALVYDRYNIDANIALSRNIIDKNIDNKYNYVCDRVENILKSTDGIFRGYLQNICSVLCDLYYCTHEKPTKYNTWRLIHLIERLIDKKEIKPNHNIHLNIENENSYGKDSINYIEVHNDLYKLKGDIYYANGYYDSALKDYKKIFNDMQNNYLQQDSVVSRKLDNYELCVRNVYDICNDIGDILNNHLQEYDEAIIYYNSAINYINAEIQNYKGIEGKTQLASSSEIIKELEKQKLHIYVNKGYTYQCKAEYKKRIFNNDSSITYELGKALENYKKAFEKYEKYMDCVSDNCENIEKRYYIKSQYRAGQVCKLLAEFYCESLPKNKENIDLSKKAYKYAKKYFEKVKAKNDTEREYLESIGEKNIHVYIISNKDIEELNSYLIEINKMLDNLNK